MKVVVYVQARTLAALRVFDPEGVANLDAMISAGSAVVIS